jgi:hypothetical protein
VLHPLRREFGSRRFVHCLSDRAKFQLCENRDDEPTLRTPFAIFTRRKRTSIRSVPSVLTGRLRLHVAGGPHLSGLQLTMRCADQPHVQLGTDFTPAYWVGGSGLAFALA